MLIDQYRDPWVWPVAVSTASSARIMAYDAYQRGARKFSIVFDQNYRFGVEAATAYDNEVKKLTGNDIDGFSQYSQNGDSGCYQAFCGVIANSASYNNEVSTVSSDLGDFMSMFLEPATALQWFATTGAPTPTGINGSPKPRLNAPGDMGAGQPLFTQNFGVNCKEQCDQLETWSGYKPAIPDFASDPNVQQFVSDLQGTKPDADTQNAFTEGGYVGMELLVKAMQQVGPDLTRSALRSVLDSTTWSSGLTIQDSTRWASGNHFASITMEPFAMEYKGEFGGWRPQPSDITQDPAPTSGTG
jgi:ABC-type branched-subunit amino acid transport system substrate-binding protein